VAGLRRLNMNRIIPIYALDGNKTHGVCKWPNEKS
jgi:hypothetical protein